MCEMKHCKPDCRLCEATERIHAVMGVLEEGGKTELADQLFELSFLFGKNPLGERLSNAILNESGNAGELESQSG